MAFVFFFLLVLCPRLEATTVVADTINVGTIGSQVASDGIYFSSAVFLAPNSSLMLSGADGYMKTASSVTAGTFIGDGSNLTGTGGIVLAATQTFSGAETFSSSVTIQSSGRQIILSTSASANNISIGNGGITFAPTLHNSSSTVIPQIITTNSTLGPCVAGSTLTIITTGGQVEALFTAAVDNPNTSSTTAIGILQDGQFVGGMGPTKPLLRGGSGSASSRAFYVNTFSYLFAALSPGSHSYCITLAAGDGGDAAILNMPGIVSNFFFLKEIK